MALPTQYPTLYKISLHHPYLPTSSFILPTSECHKEKEEGAIYISIRRTRHAGHCWRSRNELISDVLLWTPTYGRAKAGRPARTYIQQLCEDTGCSPEGPARGRWTIGKSGERGYPCYQHNMMMMMMIYLLKRK